MISVYLKLIITAVFETVLVHSTPLPFQEPLPRATPTGAYSSLTLSRVPTSNYQSAGPANPDQEPVFIENRIRQEMARTSSQLKIGAEKARAHMEHFARSTNDALKTGVQLELEDTQRHADDHVSDFQNKLRAAYARGQTALRQFLEDVNDQMLAKQQQVEESEQYSKDAFAQLQQRVESGLQELVNTINQQRIAEAAKLSQQFQSTGDLQNGQVSSDYSQLNAFGQETSHEIDAEVAAIRNEMLEQASIAWTKMQRAFAEQQQNLKRVYGESPATSLRKYLQQEQKKMAAEMDTMRHDLANAVQAETGNLFQYVLTQLEVHFPRANSEQDENQQQAGASAATPAPNSNQGEETKARDEQM